MEYGRARPTVVFPTGVGMNRLRVSNRTNIDGVPHGRGDEPMAQACERILA